MRLSRNKIIIISTLLVLVMLIVLGIGFTGNLILDEPLYSGLISGDVSDDLKYQKTGSDSTIEDNITDNLQDTSSNNDHPEQTISKASDDTFIGGGASGGGGAGAGSSSGSEEPKGKVTQEELIKTKDVHPEKISDAIRKKAEENPDEEVDAIIVLSDTENVPSEINVTKAYASLGLVEGRIRPENLDNITKESNILHLVENRNYTALMLENSQEFFDQETIDSSNYSGIGVKIAILDTGISDHPYINNVIESIDLTYENNPTDYNGHGTHIAGIIKSIAKDSSIISIKVLDSNGDGSSSTIIAGIEHAIESNASIISMSLGAPYSTPDLAIEAALKQAISQGIKVVIASGNCGVSCNGFTGVTVPGNYEPAITVGAIDSAGNYATFSGGSNYGTYIKPDIVAPGVDINSTWTDNSFRQVSGTSMAAPHITGLVALMIEKNNSVNQTQVKEILESTAIDLGEAGKDVKYGSGAVEVNRTLNHITSQNITMNNNSSNTLNGSEFNLLIFAQKNITEVTHFLNFTPFEIIRDDSYDLEEFNTLNHSTYTEHRLSYKKNLSELNLIVKEYKNIGDLIFDIETLLPTESISFSTINSFAYIQTSNSYYFFTTNLLFKFYFEGDPNFSLIEKYSTRFGNKIKETEEETKNEVKELRDYYFADIIYRKVEAYNQSNFSAQYGGDNIDEACKTPWNEVNPETNYGAGVCGGSALGEYNFYYVDVPASFLGEMRFEITQIQNGDIDLEVFDYEGGLIDGSYGYGSNELVTLTKDNSIVWRYYLDAYEAISDSSTTWNMYPHEGDSTTCDDFSNTNGECDSENDIIRDGNDIYSCEDQVVTGVVLCWEKVSSLGDSDFCSFAGLPCYEEESDCDDDTECSGNLICSQVTGNDYCCQSGDYWNGNSCVQDCRPDHDERTCYNGELYWENACDQRQTEDIFYCDYGCDTYTDTCYECTSDSHCSSSEKCSNNECVTKTCNDYPNTDGACSYTLNTQCRNGDPYDCNDLGPVNCWERLDSCTSGETCIDPTGLEGAQCVIVDNDGDGFSDSNYGGNDCNDNNAKIHPNAYDLCNSINDDCDSGTVDGFDETWYYQTTTCGVGECYSTGHYTCSNGAQANTCSPGTPAAETCNGLDDDCDGQIDENVCAKDDGESCTQDSECSNICGMNSYGQNICMQEPYITIYNLSRTNVLQNQDTIFGYNVYNPNSFSVKINLGASIKDSSGNYINDEQNDRLLNIQPGANSLQRDFNVGNNDYGTYDAIWGIHQPTFARMYDSKTRTDHIEITSCGNNVCDPEETSSTCPSDCEVNLCPDYPTGASESCDCDSDRDCPSDMFCNFVSGWDACSFYEHECNILDTYTCKDGNVHRCENQGPIRKWVLSDVCSYGEVCPTNVATTHECQSMLDYDLIIEHASNGVTVNKQSGDTLRINIKVNYATTLSLNYDTTAFTLTNGPCNTGSLNIGDNYCEFLVNYGSGKYEFTLGQDTETVKIIDDPYSLFITNIEQLFKRYNDNTGVNVLLAKTYEKAGQYNGLVYDLDREIITSHPFGFSFTSYSITLDDLGLRDNEYATKVGSFVKEKCNGCKETIIIGDDYVIPSYMNNYYDKAYLSDQKSASRTFDLDFGDMQQVFNKFDGKDFITRDVLVITPEIYTQEYIDSLELFKETIASKFGNTFTEKSASEVNCDDLGFLDSTQARPVIIFGTDESNSVIKECYGFSDSFSIDDERDSMSLERNIWDRNRWYTDDDYTYALLINTDDPDKVDTFSWWIGTEQYLNYEGKKLTLVDKISLGVGTVMIVGGVTCAVVTSPTLVGAAACGYIATVGWAIDAAVIGDQCVVQNEGGTNWFNCGFSAAAPIGGHILGKFGGKLISKAYSKYGKEVGDKITKNFNELQLKGLFKNKKAQARFFSGSNIDEAVDAMKEVSDGYEILKLENIKIKQFQNQFGSSPEAQEHMLLTLKNIGKDNFIDETGKAWIRFKPRFKDDKIKMVYRGIKSSLINDDPFEIFAMGFERSGHSNIAYHIHSSAGSKFIATTEEIIKAKQFATQTSINYDQFSGDTSGWIFVINPRSNRGIDAHKTISSFNPSTIEETQEFERLKYISSMDGEVSFPDFIYGQDIEKAIKVDRQWNVIRTENNPFYIKGGE